MSRIVRASTRPPLRVLGIDPSLGSTGFAYRDETGAVFTGTIPTGKLDGPARLDFVRTQVEALLQYVHPNFVVYEDYVNGNVKGGRVFHIGELGGVLKTLFWQRGIPVMLVSPTALKLAITGRGNADSTARSTKRTKTGKKVKDQSKPEMRAALAKHFGLTVEQGDEADACGLMLLGELRHRSKRIPEAVSRTLTIASIFDCVIITPSQQKTD